MAIDTRHLYPKTWAAVLFPVLSAVPFVPLYLRASGHWGNPYLMRIDYDEYLTRQILTVTPITVLCLLVSFFFISRHRSLHGLLAELTNLPQSQKNQREVLLSWRWVVPPLLCLSIPSVLCFIIDMKWGFGVAWFHLFITVPTALLVFAIDRLQLLRRDRSVGFALLAVFWIPLLSVLIPWVPSVLDSVLVFPLWLISLFILIGFLRYTDEVLKEPITPPSS